MTSFNEVPKLLPYLQIILIVLSLNMLAKCDRKGTPQLKSGAENYFFIRKISSILTILFIYQIKLWLDISNSLSTNKNPGMPLQRGHAFVRTIA